jgi:hypothetical protein
MQDYDEIRRRYNAGESQRNIANALYSLNNANDYFGVKTSNS